MKQICKACDRLKTLAVNGEVVCGGARYDYSSDGYGPFKQGAVCVHDDDLKDMFILSGDNRAEIIETLAKDKENLRKNNIDLKYTISVLERRLTSIKNEV